MNISIISNFLRSNRNKYLPINVDFETWYDETIQNPFSDYQVICIDITFRDDTNFERIKNKFLDIYNSIKTEDIEAGRHFIFICGYQEKELFTYNIEPEDIEYFPMNTFDIIYKANSNYRDVVETRNKGKHISKPIIKIISPYFELVSNYFLSMPIDIVSSGSTYQTICKSGGTVPTVIAFIQNLSKGSIGILPGYNTELFDIATDAIINIAKYIAIRTPEQSDKFQLEYAPQWVSKYISDKQRRLPDKIDIMQTDKMNMERICHLLYGKDTDLEFTVKYALEYLGMKVEHTESKESYDLLVRYTHEKQLHEVCAEVTGSTNVLDMGSAGRKLAQMQDMIVNKKAKRGWLIINSYCDDDLAVRQNKPLITDKIKSTILSLADIHEFNLAIITTKDIFFIWCAVLDKRLNKTDAIKLLNSMHGMSEIDVQYLPKELQTNRRM